MSRRAFLAHGLKVSPTDDYVLAYQILPNKRQWTVHLGGFEPGHYNWLESDDESGATTFFGPDEGNDPLRFIRKRESPNRVPMTD